MHVRLINPFLAVLSRLDTEATAEDPDGAGPLESGYDPVFRTTVKVPVTGQQTGESSRKNKKSIALPCQIEMEAFEALHQFAAGSSPDFELRLIFHFRDLENEGLVDDTNGDVMIRANDRLDSICTLDGQLIQEIRNPPGLYAMEVQPRTFGIGRTRNLLAVTFKEREVAARSTA